MPLLRCSCGVVIRISPGRMMVLDESGLACPECGQRLGAEPLRPFRDAESTPVDEPAIEFGEFHEDDTNSKPSETDSTETEPSVEFAACSESDDDAPSESESFLDATPAHDALATSPRELTGLGNSAHTDEASRETLDDSATPVALIEPAAGPPLSPRTRWSRLLASWSASLLVHVAVLCLVALYVVPTFVSPVFDPITIDTAWTRAEGAEAALGDEGDPTANATIVQAAAPAPHSDVVEQVFSNSTSTLAMTEPQPMGMAPKRSMAPLLSMPASSLLTPIKPARRSDPGRGGLVQGAGAGQATQGILDGIRKEAANGPVQIVWLMDASISMNVDRQEVAERLYPFYKAMALRDKSESHPLLSAVVRFGAKPDELVRTTRDFDLVTKAVAALQDDPSGLENVMTAVQFCLRQYSKWKGTLIIVVWTDESGDDTLKLEETVAMCRQQDAIVHVVGPNAVFGSERGTHLWRDAGTGFTFQLPVKRGPETSLPERLMLPYWHGFQFPPAMMNGNLVGQDLPWYGGAMREGMLSGFGPYALTRLALQTGGTFTVLNRPGDHVMATLDRLRPYTPDYSAAREYYSQAQGRPLRKAVSNAAMLIFQAPRLEPPPLTFLFSRQIFYPFNAFVPFQPASSFRTAFRDNLRTGLRGSQAELAILQKALDLYETTDLEPEYEKETSPRWKAWYDLNYGRLLANSVRHIEYQLTCESLLQADNLNTETNHVRFVPSSAYKGGRVSSGRAELARKLLERCRENNRGTPWELLAEWELNQELGLEVRQIVIPPPRPVQGGSITPTPPTRPINFPRL